MKIKDRKINQSMTIDLINGDGIDLHRPIDDQSIITLFELFFVKKYLLVGASDMLWTGGSVDQRCMYATPIRLDLLLNTNQISCYKGKWYVRRLF